MDMSDTPTPRTDRDDRPYPSPEYAQRIRFEGCECAVMHPEEYEALYELARTLERELAEMTTLAEKARTRELEQLQELQDLRKDRDSLRKTACYCMNILREAGHDEAAPLEAMVRRSIAYGKRMERDLAAMTADRDKWMQATNNFDAVNLAAVTAERDRLRAALENAERIADALVNHCDKEGGECSVCGTICCPHKDPLHFHHDGCPSCAALGKKPHE